MGWSVWRTPTAVSSIRRGILVYNDPDPPIWSNPTNVTTEDSTDADSNMDKFEDSHWLRSYTFAFDTADSPTGYYTHKVAVRYKLKAQYVDNIEVDACYVSLDEIANGATPSNTNLADGSLVPTTYLTKEFEETMYAWGMEGTTSAQLRTTNFGTYLSLYNNQTVGNTSAYCDVVECRVYVIHTDYVHAVKLPQLTLQGRKVTNRQILHINTAEMNLAVRRVGGTGMPGEVVQIINTPAATLTATATFGRLARVAKVLNLDLFALHVTPTTTKVVARIPEMGLVGIKTSSTMYKQAKTPALSLEGIRGLVTMGRVRTPSFGLVANHVTDSLSPDGTGDISLLQLYYSGVSTEDQYDSLGDVISTATGNEVYSKYQHFEATIMTGATITSTYGNPTGDAGRLDFTLGPPELYTWTPHGYLVGDTAPVDISAGVGSYILGDDEHGFLEIDCNGTYPTGNTFQTISVNTPRYRIFRVATPLDCHFGQTSYRCFYIKNTSNGRSYNTALWIDPQPAVATAFEVGLDPAGEGDGASTGVAQTIADEYTAPTGISFINPTEASPLIIDSIQSQKVKAIWVKRTVAANTTDFTLFNSMKIHIGAFI